MSDRKLIVRLLTPVLVLVVIISGCAPASEVWGVTFGERFFELAQISPEDWEEQLRELNPEGEKEVRLRGDTVRVSVSGRRARDKWKLAVSDKVYCMDQDFAAVPGHCRIGYEHGGYTWLKFCLDTKNCAPVDEELVREANLWWLCGQIICAETEDAALVEVSVEIVDSHPVTLEYLLDYSNLTAADLEGIDHEAFLQYHGVHSDNIGEFERNWFSKMLDHYKYVLNEQQWEKTAVDYGYIYEQAEGRLSPEDLDSIEVVCFSYNEGDYYEAVIIDYTTGKVYFDDDNVDDRDIIGRTADGDREWLRGVLEQCGITEWKNNYDGTSEGTTGHFFMSFAFRLSDGRCISYSADGVHGIKPSEMFTLHDALSERYYTAE